MRKFTNPFFLAFCLILFFNKSFSLNRIQEDAPYATAALMGTDFIIDNSNTDTQTDVRVVTAKNGWIFAAYSRANGTSNAGIKVKKSKNNGQTWTNVTNYSTSNARYANGLDIVVCGNDSISLVIYLMAVEYNFASNKYTAFIKKYDANTGILLSNCFTEQNQAGMSIMDCAMTTDFLNPSIVSVPYSIGAVFSLRSNPHDSLVFVYSIDGGNSFSRQVVDTTDKYFGRVAIAYGKSLSQPNGKYFLAYEKRKNSSTQIGNIRTCHTVSYPGSAFTIPFEVDTLVGSTKAVCSFPSIACQINSVDNDSADMTSVITVERDYNGQHYNHDVLYFLNKNSNDNYWEKHNVLSGTASNAKQPNIVFDIVKNTFLITYWDSISGKMPLTYKDINFSNPDSMVNVIAQYNDATANIEDAKPHISTNPNTGRTNIVWISGGINVEGIALFDSNSSLVGIEDAFENSVTLSCFPNPANGATQLRFFLSEKTSFSIEITDVSGRLLQKSIPYNFNPGSNSLELNTENLTDGYYLICLRSATSAITNKLIISHR